MSTAAELLGALVEAPVKLVREPGGGALEPLDLALDAALGDPGGALHHPLAELDQLTVDPLGLAPELAHELLAGACGGLAELVLGRSVTALA